MNCKQCNQEFSDRSNKIFCSASCKKKFKYENNNEFRERRIEYAKSKKEYDKLKLDKERINNILNQLNEGKTNNDLVELYKKIYG